MLDPAAAAAEAYRRGRGMPKKGGCCYCGCSPRRASVLRFLAPKHEEDEKEAPSFFFIRPRRRRPLNSRVALRIERRTESSSSSFRGHSQFHHLTQRRASVVQEQLLQLLQQQQWQHQNPSSPNLPRSTLFGWRKYSAPPAARP